MSTRNKDKQGNRVPYGARVRLWLTAAFVTVILAACGGGGGTGGGGGQGGGGFTPDARATVVIESATDNTLLLSTDNGVPIPGSDFTQVNVRVSLSDGSPVADGTIVNFRTNNVEVAVVATLDDPETQDIDEFGNFGTINQNTTGGVATFFVRAISPGSVTVIASVDIPATGTGTNIGISGTGSAQFDVALGSDLPPPPVPRFLLDIERTVLPTNLANTAPFLGSPFISQVNVIMLDETGTPRQPNNDEFSVAISPAQTLLFSEFDDPVTADLDEFQLLRDVGVVTAFNGQSNVFFHSMESVGSAVVTITGVYNDQGTAVTVVAQFAITVQGTAANGLPSTISLSRINNDPLYVQNSGGRTTTTVAVLALDAGTLPVSNPTGGAASFNNINVQLVNPGATGGVISAVNANGQSIVGQQANIATTNGSAEFGFNTGQVSGIQRFVATADRSDNNVDNGIQDPVSAELNINVGDGRLMSVVIDSPTLNSIQTNVVSDEVTEVAPSIYSIPFSVIANDSVGNPILQSGRFDLGKVDFPIDPNNNSLFTFSGIDGNPQEGGTLFTVPESFDGFLDDPMMEDSSVNVGDILLTLTDTVPESRELEGARFVASVSTDTLLNVVRPFNNNDNSGSIIDNGDAIPYVIGRSLTGNIPPSITLDDVSVGQFNLTYPSTAIGSPLAMFVQGVRVENGVEETVADVVLLRFPGIAPVSLSVSPNTIAGNATVPITLCASDAIGTPLRGTEILFTTASGMGLFEVSDNPLITGMDGCVTTNATSSGLNLGDEDLVIRFSGGGAETDLTIVPPNTAFISAEPSIITLTTVSARRVIATVVNEAGEPVPNLDVAATCDSPASISPGMVGTDENGEAEFVVSTTGGTPTALTTGTCVFTVDIGADQLSTSIIFSIPPVQPSPGP